MRDSPASLREVAVHLSPTAPRGAAPALVADCMPSRTWPPALLGPAILAHRAYAGRGLSDLLGFLDRPARSVGDRAALALDTALAHQLHFAAERGAALQADALNTCRIFRLDRGFVPRSDRPLRLLALVAPGSLMVNTPLDFITAHLDVRLDLLFVCPGQPLPDPLPDHDLAFCAVSECDPGTLRRLRPLLRDWPRPVLNDPAAIGRISRDGLARGLSSIPGLCSPDTLSVSRAALAEHLASPAGTIPLLARGAPALIRPTGSHAGQDLRKLDSRADLYAYLRASDEAAFFVTEFVDYRSPDGLFRKLRVAFIDGAPFLCHMAASGHWMVHYLNAGMAEHPERRDDEARAMAGFDAGFAARHAGAFAALNRWMGLDYFQIDCAELPDGRLLVFEAAVAGIVHLMDPPEVFAYKPAQMRRVFAAFDAMLRRRAAPAPASG